MPNTKNAILVALATTALLTVSAEQAVSQQTPTQQPLTSQQTSAAKDFGKLSADGSSGFQQLTLTRVAIYDGRIDDAKKYIQQAETAFDKAKGDETVFTKAEADLKRPTGKNAAANQTVSAAPLVNKPANGKSPEQMKTPIAWLPVDGTISINEDYTASAAKNTAVAEANKSLKSGDRKAAIEKLTLADMDIDVILAVVPLEDTINDVHQAVSLIDSGKYYEASQLLRQAQDGERFDISDISGKPSKM
jgi:hypothetical protein